MSAFMMNPESIAKIASYVHYWATTTDNSRLYIGDDIKNTLRDACRKQESAEAERTGRPVNLHCFTSRNLYRVLEYMNADSICQRYGDKIEDNTAPEVPAIPFWGYLKDIEMLKLIECYTYQCAEGNAPESKLYKAMETMESIVCQSIVHATKEYKDVAWG